MCRLAEEWLPGIDDLMRPDMKCSLPFQELLSAHIKIAISHKLLGGAQLTPATISHVKQELCRWLGEVNEGIIRVKAMFPSCVFQRKES